VRHLGEAWSLTNPEYQKYLNPNSIHILASINENSQLGVTNVSLTPEGREFFGDRESLRLHELHKKEVTIMAPGFLALAEDNQCCSNESNTILTFQGHPEMSEKMARLLAQGPSSYTEELSEEEIEALVARAGEEHDGLVVWKRVLEWVGE